MKVFSCFWKEFGSCCGLKVSPEMDLNRLRRSVTQLLHKMITFKFQSHAAPFSYGTVIKRNQQLLGSRKNAFSFCFGKLFSIQFTGAESEVDSLCLSAHGLFLFLKSRPCFFKSQKHNNSSVFGSWTIKNSDDSVSLALLRLILIYFTHIQKTVGTGARWLVHSWTNHILLSVSEGDVTVVN